MPGVHLPGLQLLFSLLQQRLQPLSIPFQNGSIVASDRSALWPCLTEAPHVSALLIRNSSSPCYQRPQS